MDPIFKRGNPSRLNGLERGQFSGERLFVLGSAPSLASENLKPLKNEYTWGTGLVWFDHDLPFTPTFYSFTEYARWRDYAHLLPEQSKLPWKPKPVEHVMHFVESDVLRIPMNRPEYPPEGSNVVYRNYLLGPTGSESTLKPEMMGLRYQPYDNLFGFPGKQRPLNTNSYWGISELESVQAAIWLGFDPIYLLGFDMTVGSRRLDAQAREQLENLPIVLGHMKIHVERWGTQVTNLSQTTADTVLEKSTLEEVLA